VFLIDKVVDNQIGRRYTCFIRWLQMKTIKEIKIDMGNNESAISVGVYQNDDGSYTWITFTKSGNCKRLATAMEKAGF
jgi:Protein of unknown function (DUF1391)